MKTPNYEAANTKDMLHWTMRIGGGLMILLSVLLLAKNLSYGIGDDLFCAFSLGLGAFTFVASWLPNR
ncbi:MAG: hypothetical protein IH820_03030 [Bacteroidetes bacterium]|nr:hypothetical protein [Bacteroidota bacterium]